MRCRIDTTRIDNRAKTLQAHILPAAAPILATPHPNPVGNEDHAAVRCAKRDAVQVEQIDIPGPVPIDDVPALPAIGAGPSLPGMQNTLSRRL
jgi:hypothetical protein